MKTITENTLVPISLVIAIGGGIFWLTEIYFNGQANANSITDIKQNQEKFIEDVSKDVAQIKKSLNRIEGKLDVKGD